MSKAIDFLAKFDEASKVLTELEYIILNKGKEMVFKDIKDATFKQDKKYPVFWIYSKSTNRAREAIGTINYETKELDYNYMAPSNVTNNGRTIKFKIV